MKNLSGELTNTRKGEHRYKAEEELINIEHILEDVRLTLKDQILASGVTINHDIQASQITFSNRKMRSIPEESSNWKVNQAKVHNLICTWLSSSIQNAISDHCTKAHLQLTGELKV